MDEPKYLKCACEVCGNRIEFPAEGLRRRINCPHCGQSTQLLPAESSALLPPVAALELPSQPITESSSPPISKAPSAVRRRLMPGLLAGLGLGLLVIAGGIYYVHHSRIVAARQAAEAAAAESARAEKAALQARQMAEARAAQNNGETPGERRIKSPADLKAGEIRLEKTPGNSLVHAVGTIKNDSDWQRFGVKVELDLFNAKGVRIGSAQDYKDILDPHRDWQFRALIPDKKTVSAKVKSVTEQE